MTMTLTEGVITVAVVVLGTMLTRFLPFLSFLPISRRRNIFLIYQLYCPMQLLDCWSFIA